jgi:hypothetical protein
MAVGNRKNKSYFTYTDDNGTDWNVLGEDGGAGNAVDGHTAFTSGVPVWGRQTKRRHVRYVEATDPATFRKIKFIVYTPTAYSAITPGSTISTVAPGSATAINYAVTNKIAEKQPAAATSRHLAD